MYPPNHKPRPKRYSVDELIIITDLESGELIGNVLDLHKYGLGTLLRHPIALNTPMKIRLTRRIDGQTQFIDLSVKARWCHEKPVAKKYGVGFEIDEIDIKAKLRIDELIDHHSSKQINKTT